MTANPAWIENERRVYLGAVDASAEGGSWSNFELTDPYHELLGPAEVGAGHTHSFAAWFRASERCGTPWRARPRAS